MSGNILVTICDVIQSEDSDWSNHVTIFLYYKKSYGAALGQGKVLVQLSV